LLDFPIVQYWINDVGVKLYAAEKFLWCIHFGWHYFGDRLTTLSDDQRLASTDNFIEQREAVGVEFPRG
jgi:hypothetical protein